MSNSNEAVKLMFELTQIAGREAIGAAPFCDRITLALPKPLYYALLEDYEARMRAWDGDLVMGICRIICSYTDQVQAVAHYDQGARKGDRVPLHVNIDPIRQLLAETNVSKS